jgi:hypothetical protein
MLSALFILSACELPMRQSVMDIIAKVNDYWQGKQGYRTNSYWHPSVYFAGNQEVYSVTNNPKCRTFAENWAEYNHWKGAQEDNKSHWKYKNCGERAECVIFGD